MFQRSALRTPLLVGLAILAAGFVAAASFGAAFSLGGDTKPQPRAEGRVEERAEMDWMLSRLSLLPGAGRKRTVLGVMIENHEDARPHQVGLDKALLIEEFLVEGGISRFAALYDVNDLPETVGPVRSLRPYFVDGVRPWAEAMFYAGGSPEAFARLDAHPGLFHRNGLALPEHFLRDTAIAEPHNLFVSGDALADLAAQAEHMEPVAWPPFATGWKSGGEEAPVVRLNFFSTLHNVEYRFGDFSGRYERENGGVVSDASPANVLILEIPVGGIGEYGRLSIDVTGGGRALLFRSGRLFKGRWSKASPEAPFTLEDEDGKPLTVARGQTWMTVLPDLARVSWGAE